MNICKTYLDTNDNIKLGIFTYFSPELCGWRVAASFIDAPTKNNCGRMVASISMGQVLEKKHKQIYL